MTIDFGHDESAEHMNKLAEQREQARRPRATVKSDWTNAAVFRHELATAERKAWQNLARYKFWMFGYHAGQWVYLNRVSGLKLPNPFKAIVNAARIHMVGE